MSLLTLLVAGCADDDSVEAGDLTTESAADATVEDPAESEAGSTSTTAAATSSTSTGESDTDEAGAGLVVDQLFAELGVEPSDDVIQCLTDRGIDLNALPTDEQVQQELTLGLFACAPEELAASVVDETVPPAGVDQEQLKCVAVGTFRYFGGLTAEDALVALESPDIPEEHRAVLVPQLAGECGLTDEQVNATLDA